MSPEEAKQYIVDRIAVTRQKVTIAKAFMLKNFQSDSLSLVRRFMDSVDAKMPEKIVLHQSIDATPSLVAAAEAISWRNSASEAVWDLISQAVVFPASTNLCGEIGTLAWTTVMPGSGGTSSGFSLDELSILIPAKLARRKSVDGGVNQPLSDPDLYLKELKLENCNPVIETALREAVRCLRHDLYLACLAMLGRASEAAWIDTGLALIAAAPEGSSIKSGKVADELQGPFTGIAKKIHSVIGLYSHQDIFDDVSKISGVKLQDLRNCVIWADCVRESRNSIHYGAEPAMSNSYEKVVALLIGAVPHIRLLVALSNAAKEKSRR